MAGKLLSLSDNEVKNRLINNAELCRAFPFLDKVKKANAALGTCTSCQKASKRAEFDRAVSEMRTHIANMNEADRQKFKQLLGVDQVRFWYTYWDGNVQLRKAVHF